MLWVLLSLAISMFSAGLAYLGQPTALNWLHYDQTQSFSSLPLADDVVIVEIDDKSLSELGHWSWPRSTHAALLDILSAAHVKLTVFDILFADADTLNPSADREFAKAIQRNGRVVLPLYFEAWGSNGVIVEGPPYKDFYEGAAAVGHIHIERESDGVTRAVYLKQGINTAFWPQLSLAALNEIDNADIFEIPGSRFSASLARPTAISLSKDYFNLVPMPASKQGIRFISFSDVVQGVVSPALFKDKIIFVGATATGLGDVVTTPVGSMHGVELNAWMFKALQHRLMIQPANHTFTVLVTFFVVLILVLILGRLSPRWFLAMSALSILSIILSSSALLLLAGLWITPAAAIIGVSLFFPLWSWLRAENMLRYLYHEIDGLSQNRSGALGSETRAHSSAEFLKKIGMVGDGDFVASEAGEQSALALAQGNNSTSPKGFWQAQLEGLDAQETTNVTEGKGVELVTRTISQLSIARQRDQRSRQLIEQSLSGLQDAVCIADICGTIIYANDRFRYWFDVSDASGKLDLLALLEAMRLKSGNSWVQALKQLYLNGDTYTDECVSREARMFSGNTAMQEFLCQLSLVNTWSAHKDTLILAFTDVSSLKAAENARSEALSFLSHDLRSPMVSALAILTRVAGEPSQLTPDDLNNVELLVRKNLDYAESFLQLSKVEALPDASLYPCDLHAVLDAAHVQAIALGTSKSIVVDVERHVDDAWVTGEISLLERAATNLISNAIKFSPSNSLLKLTLDKCEGRFTLAVTDQGPGISESDQASLFAPFSRGSKSNSEHGVGLGLSFVATVMERFKGEIELCSRVGKGATFTLCFPVLSDEAVETYFS